MGSLSIVHWLILLAPILTVGFLVWVLKRRGH